MAKLDVILHTHTATDGVVCVTADTHSGQLT